MQHIEVFSKEVVATAKERWLKVSELEYLLNPERTPLAISTQSPPSPPPSGTLLLYDRSFTSKYKDDGYIWVKKRNSSKVREDHVKLRVHGQFRVAGCYVHCATTTTLHRRAYHILDPETGTTATPLPLQRKGSESNGSGGVGKCLVLLHYLDTQVAAIHTAQKAACRNENATGGGRRGRKKSECANTTKPQRRRASKTPGSKASVKRCAGVNHHRQQLQYECNESSSTSTYHGEQNGSFQSSHQIHSHGMATMNTATTHGTFSLPQGQWQVPASIPLSVESMSPLRHSDKSFDDKDVEMLWSLIMDDDHGGLNAMIESHGDAMLESYEDIHGKREDEHSKISTPTAVSAVASLMAATPNTLPSTNADDDKAIDMLWNMVMEDNTVILDDMVESHGDFDAMMDSYASINNKLVGGDGIDDIRSGFKYGGDNTNNEVAVATATTSLIHASAKSYDNQELDVVWNMVAEENNGNLVDLVESSHILGTMLENHASIYGYMEDKYECYHYDIDANLMCSDIGISNEMVTNAELVVHS